MNDKRDNPPVIPCDKCGSTETVNKDCFYECGHLAEYDLRCAECNTYLGHFAYGNWSY